MKRRRSVAVVAVALSAVLVASAIGGCGHQQDRSVPPCAAPRFPAPYVGTNPCSPEAVLTSAASAIFTYRPDRQHDSAAAYITAAPLIAPDYLHRIGTSATALAPITAATWARWSSLHITVTAEARVTTDDHPADTSNQALRVIAVTQHPGDEPPRALTAYMQATRDGSKQPWLVTELEVR